MMISEPYDTAAKTAENTSAWGALASLSLSVLVSALGVSIANVALPTLAQVFAASFQQVQWIVLAYLLSVTALVVSAGRLGDTMGRRGLLLSGLLLFTVASILCGLAPNLWALVSLRGLQGVGAAILMALTLAMVGETVPKERTGSAMGLLGALSAVGTALGPTLGGFLISGFGWRAIFLVMAPLGFLALALGLRYLPADRSKSERRSFDIPGTFLLAATLGAYALAMTMGRGSFGFLNAGLLAATVLGAALFIAVETRVASPLISLMIFREPGLGAGLMTSLLVAAVAIATLVVGPFYLSRTLGLDPARVGLVLSIGPLVAAMTSIPAGRLVDRFGAQRMTILGLSSMAAGSFTLAMLPSIAGIAGYIAPLVILTAGYALFQASNNTAIMKDVGPDRRGVVSGMLNLSRNLGLITGAAALGAVFALASATKDIATADPAAVATGMKTTFAVAAGLMVSSLAIVIVGRMILRKAKR
jgi:EmrB/QacA subfamily drug resistance transporter